MRSKTFDTSDEAEDFEDALRRAKRTGVFVKKQSAETLRTFWTEYLHDYATHDLEAATVDGHKRAWTKWIEPSLGHIPLAMLSSSPELIQQLKLDMIEAGAGVPTQKRVLAVLSAICTKAVQLQRITSNPVIVIAKPKAKPPRPVQALSLAQVETLIGHFKTNNDRLLVALIAYAGVRPGEALALDSTEIGTKSLAVNRALKLDGVGPTKTNSTRVVPVRDELLPYLTDLSTGLLFLDESGKYWSPSKFRNWRIRQWQAAAVKAGLGEITKGEGKRSYVGPPPYHLRHTAASTWLYEGVDPIRVASWMGHSPAVLFKTYAHVIGEVTATTARAT